MDLGTYYILKPQMPDEDQLLSYSILPFFSIIAGILLSKMAYDVTNLISSYFFEWHSNLPKPQQIEWGNRGMSTVHAIYITIMSLYMVFFSDLYSDDQLRGLITFRSSSLSNFTLGVSVGYFIADLGMISWFFPSLGGVEFVFHHLLSVLAISYSMFSREGQVYVFMVLISEATTPGVNLRWFLDIAGKQESIAYVINGVLVLFGWLVARILLFGYFFYHVIKHYDQGTCGAHIFKLGQNFCSRKEVVVREVHIYGYLLIFGVPSILAIMNMIWFGKILQGLMKYQSSPDELV